MYRMTDPMIGPPACVDLRLDNLPPTIAGYIQQCRAIANHRRAIARVYVTDRCLAPFNTLGQEECPSTAEYTDACVPCSVDPHLRYNYSWFCKEMRKRPGWIKNADKILRGLWSRYLVMESPAVWAVNIDTPLCTKSPTERSRVHPHHQAAAVLEDKPEGYAEMAYYKFSRAMAPVRLDFPRVRYER